MKPLRRRSKPTSLSESFFRLVIFAGGLFGALIVFKTSPLIKDYIRSRKAEKLAIRLKATKGWLDYRLESEKSSRQFHDAASRVIREFGRMGYGLRYVAWTLKK